MSFRKADEKPTESTEETTENPLGFIPGDVKADEVINVFDAAALRSMLLKDIPDVIEASAADTNGDGSITIADLVLLHEYLVGMDVELTYYKGV